VRPFCLYNSAGSLGWLDCLPEINNLDLDVVLGDIRDPLCVREALRGVDQVFHLAALIAIPYSYAAPASYVVTNILGTLNVVQAARDLGISRVVHTSTSETYGTAQYVPITEEHPLVGQSPYAASKIGADQIALSYWRSFETPVAVLRPSECPGSYPHDHHPDSCRLSPNQAGSSLAHARLQFCFRHLCCVSCHSQLRCGPGAGSECLQ